LHPDSNLIGTYSDGSLKDDLRGFFHASEKDSKRTFLDS